MLDRVTYMALAVSLNIVGIGALLGIIAAIFSRPFWAVAVDLWPAVAVCLIATVIHAVRQDLDS